MNQGSIKIIIIFLGLGFLLAVLFLVLFMFVHYYRITRYQKEKTRMQANFDQELLQTQIEIQDQTLRNISGEIHDNIGQVLSLVKLNLNTFPQHLEEPVQKKIQDTELLLSQAINDLRDLSQSMNSDRIAFIGLEASLEQELKQLQKTGRYITRLHTDGNRYVLDTQKEMVLFRIVQESLNNIVKHSGAKNIEIELLFRADALILQVSDDGKGFNTGMNHLSKNGIGLKNMHNRAALIGAVFSVHSSINNGTSIIIELKKSQSSTETSNHQYGKYCINR